MTATRRSMDEALRAANLPPEAIELIREGSPKPRVNLEVVEKPAAAEAPAPEEGRREDVAGNVAASVAPESEPARRKRREPRPPLEETPEKAAVEAAGGEGLVSVTFRVPARIPAGLVQASADRKVKRVRPYTQQEIVAEAIGGWLKERGYIATGAE